MVLGNVAILVGSGIIGSVLTSGDAKIPSAGEVLSGAAKFVKKHGKEGKDKDASSSNDVHTAQLLSQVNHLRQEIQYLGSRPVTVVTNAARSGTGKFTITAVVVAGVIAYAYIKWKGWKLSDMMFVTKRGLSDACNVVGSQLDRVSDDVTAARQHLAGRIDRVDISLDETQEIIEGTRDEVTAIHVDLSSFQEDLQSVNLVVRTLESKLVSLEYTQEQQGVVSGTSSTKEASSMPSNGASSSSEGSRSSSMGGRIASTSRFGRLRLPGLGLGFLMSGSFAMGDYTIQISTKLIEQLARDDEKVKKKTRKPKPSKFVKQHEEPQENSRELPSEPKSTTDVAPGWPLPPPMYLPVATAPPPPAVAELEAIRAVLEESEKVQEKLDKQHAGMRDELLKKSKDLRDKEFKLPYQNPTPCTGERDNCLKCYVSNAQDPLKCAEAVKRFEACVRLARQTGNTKVAQ
ncbi:hypothetical protein ABZP36_013045 [Zizania latifolia]